MNHWKRMAFVFALAAGLCGSAWAQWEHRDRGEGPGYGQQNPNYQRGYSEGLSKGQWDVQKHRAYQPQNYESYKHGDEAYRRGFVSGYDAAFGRHQGHDEWAGRERDRDHNRYDSHPTYQKGYSDGLSKGQWDVQKNRAYQPQNYEAYKNGDEAYRRGFVRGYDEAFGRHQGHDEWAGRERDRDHNRYESNASFQKGYNDGLSKGRWDLQKNRAYQPQNYEAYKNGDEAYRRGFIKGYDEGIGRTRR